MGDEDVQAGGVAPAHLEAVQRGEGDLDRPERASATGTDCAGGVREQVADAARGGDAVVPERPDGVLEARAARRWRASRSAASASPASRARSRSAIRASKACAAALEALGAVRRAQQGGDAERAAAGGSLTALSRAAAAPRSALGRMGDGLDLGQQAREVGGGARWGAAGQDSDDAAQALER